jgi:hypothetical protein
MCVGQYAASARMAVASASLLSCAKVAASGKAEGRGPGPAHRPIPLARCQLRTRVKK